MAITEPQRVCCHSRIPTISERYKHEDKDRPHSQRSYPMTAAHMDPR